MKFNMSISDLLAIFPKVAAKAVAYWSDDHHISAEEGVLLLAYTAEELAPRADDDKVKALFMALATVLKTVAPLLAEEEK